MTPFLARNSCPARLPFPPVLRGRGAEVRGLELAEGVTPLRGASNPLTPTLSPRVPGEREPSASRGRRRDKANVIGPTLAWILCAAILGCQGDSAPSKVEIKPPTAAEINAEVLRVLDPYDPMYLLDPQGRVIHLRVPFKHLTSRAMIEIGKLTELRELELNGTSFANEDLAHLKNLQRLFATGIGNSTLTDEGLSHLEKLQGLRYMWVPKSGVTEEGVQKLKKALPGVNVYFI
jgi:hypothetical protein